MNFELLTGSLFLGVCIAGSFLLSGMESGVFALSRLRVRKLCRGGDVRARILQGCLDHPEDFLWSILVGNTLATFCVVVIMVFWLHDRLGHMPAWFWLAFILLGLLYHILCDLLPKTLFQRFPNRLCLAMARPFRFLQVLLGPGVRSVSWLARGLARAGGGQPFRGQLFGNRDELRLVMQESAQVLSSDEHLMINRLLDLQKAPVSNLVIPMGDVVCARADAGVQEVLALMRDRPVAVMPVVRVEGGRDRVIGVLHMRQLLFEDPAAREQEERKVGDLVTPALFLDLSVRLDEALRRMQRGGQRLAIVLGASGEEVGIITLSDVLRSVFGEVTL